MSNRKFFVMLLFIPALYDVNQKASGQTVDSSSFKINSRQSFYSFEKKGEFLLHIPAALLQKNLSINIKICKDTIVSWNGKPGRNMVRLPFSLKLTPSVYNIEAGIIVTASPGII